MMNAINLEMVCPFCGQIHMVTVDEGDFLNWQNGELAQNVFPYLSATEREQMISHICPDCQKSVFGEEEDE